VIQPPRPEAVGWLPGAGLFCGSIIQSKLPALSLLGSAILFQQAKSFTVTPVLRATRPNESPALNRYKPYVFKTSLGIQAICCRKFSSLARTPLSCRWRASAASAGAADVEEFFDVAHPLEHRVKTTASKVILILPFRHSAPGVGSGEGSAGYAQPGVIVCWWPHRRDIGVPCRISPAARPRV